MERKTGKNSSKIDPFLAGVKLFRNSTILPATFQTEVINHIFKWNSKFHAKSMTIPENFHSTPTKMWPKFPETCSKQAWNEHSSLMEILYKTCWLAFGVVHLENIKSCNRHPFKFPSIDWASNRTQVLWALHNHVGNESRPVPSLRTWLWDEIEITANGTGLIWTNRAN